MLEDGLIVTVVGIGVVFLFLTLLVFSMNVMAKAINVINKFFPEEVAETVSVSTKRISTDDDVAVAIAVAKMNM